MEDYTFEDWENGEPEPEKIKNRDVEDSIRYNQRQAFEAALEIDLRSKKYVINKDFLDKMPDFDRNEFLSLELQKTNEHYDSFDIDKQKIILRDFSPYGIKAKNCHFIEIGLNNELGCDLNFLKDNLIFQGRATYQYLKYLQSLCEFYSKLTPPQNPPKSQSKEFFTLAKSFNDKFGKDEGIQKLNDLKAKLYKEGVLSEDHSTWVGVGMHGKSQLASLIKYVAHKFINKSFSENQVIFISEKDFNNKVSKGTVKKALAENAEFYFK